MYEGIMTPLITPLDADGRVAADQLRKLVARQVAAGVTSILVLGGTGEYSALDEDQRRRAIDLAVEAAGGSVPVVAGILAPGLGDAVVTAKYARAAGVDALMVLAPFYVRPTHGGFVDYFERFDAAVDMPFLLYNIPHKTSVNLEPATVEAIVDAVPNVVGIKECATDLGQFLELVHRVGGRIDVLSGEDHLGVPEMVLGAKGAVMASANLVPEFWVEAHRLIRSDRIAEAVREFHRHLPLFRGLFMEGNPAPLKAAMSMVGDVPAHVSTPLRPISDRTRDVLRGELEAAGLV